MHRQTLTAIPLHFASVFARARVGLLLLPWVVAPACAPRAALYATRSASADSLVRAAVLQEKTLLTANIPQNTLTVAPLTVISPDTSYASLGYGMSALLVNDLAHSRQLSLVERLRIDAVLRELDLNRRGRVDSVTGPRVGRLVGARRVVVGVMDLRPRGNLAFQAQVANAVTGRVGAVLTGGAQLTQIFEAEKALVFRLFDALNVTLTPSERRAVEAQTTRNIAAFLAFSRGTRAEAFGDVAGARGNYAEAAKLDPGFRLARERLSSIQGTVVPTTTVVTSLSRAVAISTDLINRPAPVVIGTGTDVPFAAHQQLITFTITVRHAMKAFSTDPSAVKWSGKLHSITSLA